MTDHARLRGISDHIGAVSILRRNRFYGEVTCRRHFHVTITSICVFDGQATDFVDGDMAGPKRIGRRR